jgi:hypothetical protein
LERIAIYGPLGGCSRSDHHIDVTEDANRLNQDLRIYRKLEVLTDRESHNDAVGRNQINPTDATYVDTGKHYAVAFVQPRSIGKDHMYHISVLA